MDDLSNVESSDPAPDQPEGILQFLDKLETIADQLLPG